MNRDLKNVQLSTCRLLLIWLVMCFAATTRADTDYGINATVWKMLYGVTDAQLNDPAWLARDDDGDGVSNGAELAAGTNPFSPASKFAVASSTFTTTMAALTVPTVAGKVYVLQSSADLTNPAGWAPLTNNVQVTGDGTVKTLTGPPADGIASFYRVVVQDVDTDGDGVSDWAEDWPSGLDPTTAHTNGATLDDHTTLANDLAGENIVTITATKATATQPPNAATAASDFGTITVSRGGTLHFASLTVPLVWSGTAVSDTDYSAMPTSVTFAPKVGVVTLTLARPAQRDPAHERRGHRLCSARRELRPRREQQRERRHRPGGQRQRHRTDRLLFSGHFGEQHHARIPPTSSCPLTSKSRGSIPGSISQLGPRPSAPARD